MTLKLEKAIPNASTETSQRFLDGARESVEGVLDSLKIIRADRKSKSGASLRGRLAKNEEDLLRAALVFTGAGLDATLKQLVRETLQELIAVDPNCAQRFESFLARRLRGTGESDTKVLARYLAAEDPRQRAIEDYLEDLTGGSLQSVDQLHAIAAALGLEDQALRQRISDLRPLFDARNQVVHELDLQKVERHGDRTRRTRAIATTKASAQDGLEVAQVIVNAVGLRLQEGKG